MSVWTCQRVTKGEKCGWINEPRARKCFVCEKPRPKKRKPKHTAALNESYEAYVVLNGGEQCGICGAVGKTRRLHRDHDHRTGKPRGLLCFSCNSVLRARMTAEWMEKAIVYLRRCEP